MCVPWVVYMPCTHAMLRRARSGQPSVRRAAALEGAVQSVTSAGRPAVAPPWPAAAALHCAIAGRACGRQAPSDYRRCRRRRRCRPRCRRRRLQHQRRRCRRNRCRRRPLRRRVPCCHRHRSHHQRRRRCTRRQPLHHRRWRRCYPGASVVAVAAAAAVLVVASAVVAVASAVAVVASDVTVPRGNAGTWRTRRE